MTTRARVLAGVIDQVAENFVEVGSFGAREDIGRHVDVDRDLSVCVEPANGSRAGTLVVKVPKGTPLS